MISLEDPELREILGKRPAARTIVLCLPRGGAPVAKEVAKAFHCPLDLILVRKLGCPDYAEVAMGALASLGGGTSSVPIPDTCFHFFLLVINEVWNDYIANYVSQSSRQQVLEKRKAMFLSTIERLTVAGCM